MAGKKKPVEPKGRVDDFLVRKFGDLEDTADMEATYKAFGGVLAQRRFDDTRDALSADDCKGAVELVLRIMEGDASMDDIGNTEAAKEALGLNSPKPSWKRAETLVDNICADAACLYEEHSGKGGYGDDAIERRIGQLQDRAKKHIVGLGLERHLPKHWLK